MNLVLLISAVAQVSASALDLPSALETPVAPAEIAAEASVAGPLSIQEILSSAPQPLSEEPLQPRFLTDAGRGPQSDDDAVYERRVLGVFRAAQGQQGALDGRWLVAQANGEALYTLQIADPGAGAERIEGAWGAPEGKAGLRGSGLIEAVRQEASDLVVRFYRDGAYQGPAELRIRPVSGGGWTGELITDDHRQPVILRRDIGVEVAAQQVPVYEPPRLAPAAKAKPRPAQRKGRARKNRRSAAR